MSKTSKVRRWLCRWLVAQQWPYIWQRVHDDLELSAIKVDVARQQHRQDEMSDLIAVLILRIDSLENAERNQE